MKTRRRTSAAEPERTSLDQGDFRLNGSWNWSAEAIHRGPFFAFVRDLCRARTAAKLSPAEVAERIVSSKWGKAFGELEQWATLARWEDWPFARCRTAADSAVKRSGIGPALSSHWQGGAYVGTTDEREFESPTQEQARAMIADLAKQLGWKDLVLPDSSTAERTSGHDPRCNCEECFANAWQRVQAAQAVGG